MDHPRYLSFIPCAPTEASRDVRPRRRRLVDLRRLVARGRRRGLRRERRRCAGSPTWPACRRRPVGSSCPAARSATCRRSWPPGTRRGRATPRPAAAARGPRVAAQRQRPLLDRVAPCEVMDVDFVGVPVDEPRRLTGAALRAGARGRRARTTFFAVVATVGHDELRHRRRPRLGRRGVPRVRPVAPRRRRLRRRRPGRAVACATCSPASSTPTRSSSTRTSGCSRRSTAAPCSTASPPLAPGRAHPEGRLPRRAHRRRRTGTPPTTPSG